MTVLPEQFAGPDTLADPDSDIGPSPEDCDDGGPIQSFLYVNGAEVANGARTLGYMANASAGSCQPKFEISPGCPCWIQRVEAVGDIGVFISPAQDPAPWYDATHPESGDFLGLLIDTDSERSLFDGLAVRNVTPRTGGLTGAAIGPARLDPRVWQVKGYLIAASCRGMEYGRRWLAQALSGLCDPCALGELRVRSSCPPCDGTDDTIGQWFTYDAALTAGPNYAGSVDPDCCCAEQVSFTVTMGNPYLYKSPVVCAAATAVIPSSTAACIDFNQWFCEPPDQICCTVNPPSIGTLGTIITIRVASSLTNLGIATYPACPPGSQSPTAQMTVPSLPAGSVLVIDSARRIITFTDVFGVSSDGTPYIQLPEGQGIPWVEISDCNPSQCLCAGIGSYCSADGATTVEIATQERQG